MKKVAVIGLGNISERHRKNIKYLYPDSKVYAVSSSGRKPNEVISDSDEVVNSVQKLLDFNIDYAIVASPATFHCEHAIALIQANIPVLIEKPIAASSKNLEKLKGAILEFNGVVAVAYCLRYLPSSLLMKDLVETNAVGDIYNVFVDTGEYLPNWRPKINYKDSVSANKELGGGVLLELSHDIDYLKWLLGPLNVEFSNLRKSKELSLEVEDMADVILSTSLGGICNLHLDFLQKNAQRSCCILGSKGRLDWDLISNSIRFSNLAGEKVLYSAPEFDKNSMYLDMILDFENMIESKQNKCISFEDASETLKLVDTIKLIATGKK